MTENAHQAPPAWTYPGSAYPPPPAPKPPRRLRGGTVALVAAATLVAGGIGGTVGALVGGDAASQPTVAATTTGAAGTETGTETVDVSAVVSTVLPSVVQVNVRRADGSGVGSGVIVGTDGRILTNDHVVAGASEVTVTLADGRTVAASVLGTDTGSDLALVQAEDVSGLTAASFADSDAVRVGDEVIAIGSPGGLLGTVTTGIVSALDRDVTVSADPAEQDGPFAATGAATTTTYQALQTDAAINQGNSGGPLFNTQGQVVGINSAMYSPVSSPDGAAGSVGIGFAIPSNHAQQVIARL